MESLNSASKKTPWGKIIIFALLILAIAHLALFYSKDESKVASCQAESECGAYEIFYFTGKGFVCVNDDEAKSSSIKSKVLMFKYASKNSVPQAPSGCECVNSLCEIKE